MKYTIELTGRQRKRFKHMNKALIKMGMGFDILSLLEPVKTTNVEDTSEYKIGYTQAIADYRKFERFFNSVGGIEVFEDIRNTDGTLSIDMILQYLPMPEIMARIKAYEEKKKAEEEIKVGDEVKSVCGELVGVVTRVNQSTERFRILFSDGSGGMTECFPEDYEKTGRHFEIVEELLNQLRGNKNEKD